MAVLQIIGLLVMLFYTNHKISEVKAEKYYWKRKYRNLKETGNDSYQIGDEEYY